jgi:hypothetical protein
MTLYYQVMEALAKVNRSRIGTSQKVTRKNSPQALHGIRTSQKVT